MLIVRHNDYPHSSVLSAANSAVAAQQEAESHVLGYFALRSRNDALNMENAQLREQVALLQQLVDDSLTKEAAAYAQTFRYIPAKVVQQEHRMSHNYLTINRGAADGLRVGMGVRNADGVVGVICTVGEKYSLVLPIIHTQSRISCMLLENGYMGTLTWPGDNDHYAMLQDVAIHVQLAQGDTLVTSGMTTAFPRGIPVGTVDKCHIEDGDSYYTIQVRLATDFRSLSYVQVIDNRSESELKALTNGLD